MRMGGLPRGAAATLVVCLATWAGAATSGDIPQPVATAGSPVDARTEEPERPTFEGTSEVVASRITDDPAAAGRREVLVTREEIAALPVTTVQDVLALLPGVGLARRGARGMQGDLNLRGSTFEQALVMVNGVRVNNPQTGHHHLDLFVPLAAIERVEVLYGSGAAVHGPDAFGGAINIVTAPPGTGVWARVGDHHLAGGGVAGSFGPGLWAAAEREVHTGFRDNTEADVNQLAGGWSWRRGDASADLLLAGGSRDFGAHAFYSMRFPDERESTDGRLVTVRATTPLGSDGLRLDASLRLGSHRDDFILDRARPDWFRNLHRTDGALVSAVLRSQDRPWRWAAGVEGAREELESTNLGDRHLVRTAVFAEAARDLGPVTLSLQGRADHQDDWGTEPTWGLGGSWRVTDGWRLRAHVGTSFRVPSFTDLYYTSPSTVGNPDLEPEQGRSAELGLDVGALALTVFDREADPIIDYLLGDDGVWRAANAGRVTTRGVEAAVTVPAWGRLRWQRLGAVWLDSDLGVDPVRSAYALGHPELEASWTGIVDGGRGWTAGWTVRYRQPRDAGSWATLDLRVGRRILEAFELTLEASNVFDRDLTELHGVPLPGRWVALTAAWRPVETP